MAPTANKTPKPATGSSATASSSSLKLKKPNNVNAKIAANTDDAKNSGVFFSSHSDKSTAYLSNFARFGFERSGVYFATVEQYVYIFPDL
jgi:hypothetical protein